MEEKKKKLPIISIIGFILSFFGFFTGLYPIGIFFHIFSILLAVIVFVLAKKNNYNIALAIAGISISFLSLILVWFAFNVLGFSLNYGGFKPNINNAEYIYIEELHRSINENTARAIEEHDKKTYAVSGTVEDIGGNSCYLYSGETSKYRIKVYLDTDELATIDEGDNISVYGKLDVGYTGNSLALENSSILEDKELQKIKDKN